MKHTIVLDRNTQLFYKGVAAGGEITEAHADVDFPDHDTKVNVFFFYGGVKAAEAGCTSKEDFGFFMQGLVLQAPRTPEPDEDDGDE